tara:strand:+ start:1013 stop:1294 length:282 start_codon:yes stop_codon:yes gene_type:complete
LLLYYPFLEYSILTLKIKNISSNLYNFYIFFSFIFTLCFANDDPYQKNKINNYKKKLINKNLLINTTGIYEEYLNKSSVDLFLIVITNQKNKN